MPGGLKLRLTTFADGDTMDPVVLSRLVAELDLVPEVAVVCRQVHGARVVPARPGAGPDEADGLFTSESLVPLVLRGADCPLVCLHDEDAPSLVVVHAGWRGIVAGVLESGLASLGRPARYGAWISAHAGPCCYEVGEEVAAEFPDAAVVRRPGEKPHLDLAEAIAMRLGRRPEPLAGECTICGGGYFSYRGTGTAERHALIAALTP